MSEAPILIGIGACCSGLPIVAAVMVAVFRMVIGSPPTFTVSVGVVASVAGNIKSTNAVPIGKVMLPAPSGHVIQYRTSVQHRVIEPAASLQYTLYIFLAPLCDWIIAVANCGVAIAVFHLDFVLLPYTCSGSC